MPRAIIFDLAEVLIQGIPGAEGELAEVFSVPAEEITAGMRGPIMDEHCRGNMTEDQYWARTMDENSWEGDIEKAKAALRRNFHRKVPGTEELLRELAARYDTYLLSDHAREWIAYIEGVHEFFALFKRRFYSFDLGSIKPEPATFRKVLAELSLPAAEIVFIDDQAPNVANARAAGIDGVQFTGADRLRGELAARGI